MNKAAPTFSGDPSSLDEWAAAVWDRFQRMISFCLSGEVIVEGDTSTGRVVIERHHFQPFSGRPFVIGADGLLWKAGQESEEMVSLIGDRCIGTDCSILDFNASILRLRDGTIYRNCKFEKPRAN